MPDIARDDAIRDASDRTDEALASRASSITRLTDEEVQALFPTPADVKRLKDLMKIVRSADDHNQKINRLVDNIQDLGGSVITLLERFA